MYEVVAIPTKLYGSKTQTMKVFETRLEMNEKNVWLKFLKIL